MGRYGIFLGNNECLLVVVGFLCASGWLGKIWWYRVVVGCFEIFLDGNEWMRVIVKFSRVVVGSWMVVQLF